MNKWIAEFDLEEGDTMPEHMDLNYMGAHIDFHCRPMWIPVSERLPKDNASYLVTVKQGYIMIGIWCGNPEYWENVIAWMPLPSSYQG